MNEVLEELMGFVQTGISGVLTPEVLIPAGLASIVGTWHSLRDNVKGKSNLGLEFVLAHSLTFPGTGIASYLIAKGYGGSDIVATTATLLGLYAYHESYGKVDVTIQEYFTRKEDVNGVSGIDKQEENPN